MKPILNRTLAIITLCFFASVGFSQCESGAKKTTVNASVIMHGHEDIIDVAMSNENFTTLVAAVKAANLVDALKGDGPFTVFAPTNAAFNNLPEGTVASLLKPENKDMLTSILTYHVVKGKLTAADILDAIEKSEGEVIVTTLNGRELTAKIWDGNVYLKDEKGNKSKVIITDVEASNGVIHAIDTVVMPK